MTKVLESNFKQRLLGAAVMVALAVIFLPMVLDGDAQRFGGSHDATFPEPPEFKMQTRILTLGTGIDDDEIAQQDDAVEEPIVWEDATDSGMETLRSNDGESESSIAGLTDSKDKLETEDLGSETSPLATTETHSDMIAIVETAEPPELRSDVSSMPEQIAAAKKVPPAEEKLAIRGWYVQAASFGKLQNARSLVAKLRQKGWPAGDEPVAVNQRRIYRVYAGPFRNKAKAVAEQARLEKAFVLGKTRLYRRGSDDLAIISAVSSEQQAVQLTTGWSVQVGNFGNSVNAEKLQTRVSKAGFDAYVESISGASAQSFRVRIGPVLERRDAESLKRQIKTKLNLPGFVVSHP